MSDGRGVEGRPAIVRLRDRVWVQVVFVLFLAALAVAAGGVGGYLQRCKPGQGNDWCGLSEFADVVLGLVAAVLILVVGMTIILLRRKRSGGGRGPGALRVAAVVVGVLFLLPSAYMLVLGWSRNSGSGGLWLGVGLGVGLIGVAFWPRRVGVEVLK